MDLLHRKLLNDDNASTLDKSLNHFKHCLIKNIAPFHRWIEIKILRENTINLHVIGTNRKEQYLGMAVKMSNFKWT